MEQKLKEQDWKLEDLFLALNEFPSAGFLDSFIYIAQDLEVLKPKYKFHYTVGTSGLPSSPEVYDDIHFLEDNRFIYIRYNYLGIFTESIGEMKLNKSYINKYCSLNNKTQERLRKIAKVDAARIDSLATILHVKKLSFPDVPKENLRDKLSDRFLVSKNKMNEYFMQLRELEYQI